MFHSSYFLFLYRSLTFSVPVFSQMAGSNGPVLASPQASVSLEDAFETAAVLSQLSESGSADAPYFPMEYNADSESADRLRRPLFVTPLQITDYADRLHSIFTQLFMWNVKPLTQLIAAYAVSPFTGNVTATIHRVTLWCVSC